MPEKEISRLDGGHTKEDFTMAKTLIAFFSRADENYFGGAMRYVKVGNTEIVVNDMKEMIDADTFRIEMKNPYSPVYMTCIDEAKKDLRVKARPELVSMPSSIDEYDTVVLAYPNYWGTMPMPSFFKIAFPSSLSNSSFARWTQQLATPRSAAAGEHTYELQG